MGSTKAAPTVKVKKMWHFSDLNITKIDNKQEEKSTSNKLISQNFVFLEKCSSKEANHLSNVNECAFNIKEVIKVKTSLCRICLKEGTIPIHGDNSSKDLSDAISTCGGIDISIFDSFPKYLCASCHALLQDAMLFRNFAQSSDRLLKKSSLSEPTKDDSSKDMTNVDNKAKEVSGPAQEDLRRNNLHSIQKSHSPINIIFKVPDSSIMLDSDYLFRKLKLSTNITENATNDESDVPKLKQNPGTSEKLNFKENKESILTIRKYKKKKYISNKANTQNFSNEFAMEQVNKSLKQNKILLNCKDCDMEFATYQDYSEHLLQKGIHKKSVKNKKCILCRETDAVQYVIKYNPNMQKPVRMYLCEICSPKDMKTGKAECNEKLYSLRQQIKLKCQQCGRSFSTCQKLGSHKCTHKLVLKTSKISHKICLKTSSSARKKLQRMEEDKCVCDICGKTVVNLSYHRKCHLRPSISKNDLKFLCTVCPYKTHYKPNLKIHMRFHTGERPYLCDECPKKFVTKSNLIKHRYSHKSTRNFQCECGREYHREKELDEHIKVDHNGIKEHICETCGKAFGRRSSLTQHQLLVHKREKQKGGIPPSYLKFEGMDQQDSTTP